MGSIRTGIKVLLAKFFDIHLAVTNTYKQPIYRVKLLDKLGIDLVADVGANIGQYAQELISSGYKNKIISFEPLSDIYGELVKNSSGFKNWEVYERCAIGNENGEVEINVSENYESSSIFNVLDKSIEAEPSTKFIKKEKVKVARLGDILKFDPQSKIHLKIDVQGYEEMVLSGAENIFGNVRSLELEISLIPLYEGVLSPQKLLTKLSNYGFSPAFYVSVFDDVNSGGILQLNGLFVKNELLHLIN